MIKPLKKEKSEETQRVEGEIKFFEGFPTEVKEIIAKAGSRGEVTQVLCLILDGPDKNKTIRRNVKGPVRMGDTLILLETEIEAQKLGGGRRGGRKKPDKS